MLTVGALFAGIGGIELGLERTKGFRTIWAVEIDKFCQKVLKKNFGGIEVYGDIKEIDWAKVERPDVLTGGFPCQDISIAGKRKGIKADTRSGLWFEYLKAIRALRPRYVIIENVSALHSCGLDIVLAGLAEVGYDAEWIDIRASDFGAPHRRERLFIVAYPDVIGRDHRGDNERGYDVQETAERSIPQNQQSGSGWQRRDDALPAPVFADDARERLESSRERMHKRGSSFRCFQDVRRIEDLRGRPDIPEPLFRGARDGVPDWMDRIKACGNAVVPDCAEFVGEMILGKEAKGRAVVDSPPRAGNLNLRPAKSHKRKGEK